MLNKNKVQVYKSTGFTNSEVEPHIPISNHYDHDTLLTKNGDLIQIIEITGYEENAKDFSTNYDLRDSIRNAIKSCIPSFNYAVYLHTLRTRKNLMPSGVEPFGFAEELNNKWCKTNNWDKQLVNTVYISIVRQGEKNPLLDLKSLLMSLSFPKFKNTYKNQLDKNREELNSVANRIVEKLGFFGARKLTLLKTDKGYLSEQLFFYYNLISLQQFRTNPPIKSLSEYLSDVKSVFDFNTLELSTLDTQKQFAAVFTLKDSIDLPIETINKFNQLGINFIISQAMYFVSEYQLKKEYDKVRKLRSLANDSFIDKVTGFKDLFSATSNSPANYCAQQTTITIHSDDYEFFTKKVQQAISTLSSMGIAFCREDLLMVNQFFAQLPGNLKYLIGKRMSLIPTDKVGSFCSIHHHLSGSYKGSIWGPPISLLRNADGTPFFFNFHNSKGEGNTIVIGPEKTGKTVLLRFFLAQASKLSPRIIYIDTEGVSKRYIESIGGTYINLTEKSADNLKLSLNPFSLENFANNPEYLQEWLQNAIFPGSQKVAKYNEFFKALTDKLFEHQHIEDKISLIKETIEATQEPTLIDGLNNFLGSEKFNSYFNQISDQLEPLDLNNIISLDVSGMIADKVLFTSYIGILKQKIKKVLDGSKTIIVMPRFSLLYEIKSFYPLFSDWLKEINQKNAIGFFSTSQSDDQQENQHFLKHVNSFPTRIFMSDKFADKYFMRAFKLNEEELYRIKSYDVSRHMFLLKQENISIVLSLNLGNLKEVLKVLESKDD